MVTVNFKSFNFSPCRCLIRNHVGVLLKVLSAIMPNSRNKKSDNSWKNVYLLYAKYIEIHYNLSIACD